MYDTDTTTYIMGHTSPDTDAIVSAIAYATFLSDQGYDVEPIALGKANNETQFVLDYVDATMPRIVDTLPEGAHVILVDHNEKKQSIYDIDTHHIKGVIDHHKMGDFSTHGPLFMRVEALGSTASILYKMFKEQGYTPSSQLATMMISAIVSDTLYFRSPTTTQEDKAIVQELNAIAGIEDLEAYSMKMFAAKSDLGDISAKDLVQLDYKNFEFGNLSAGIGVIETTDPAYALGRKEEIVNAIQSLKQEKGLDCILLCVIDILEQKNTCIVASEKEADIIHKAFGATTNNHLADLGARVSRKKQIVPPLSEHVS